MNKRENVFTTIIMLLIVLLVGASLFFSCTPSGLATCNRYKHTMHEVDDETNYYTKKQVEDTCRAMISSYTSDKLVYEQYKDSDNAEEIGWANQAKMRANKTASTYNNFLLKNNYVWRDDVPSDIFLNLEYLE